MIKKYFIILTKRVISLISKLYKKNILYSKHISNTVEDNKDERDKLTKTPVKNLPKFYLIPNRPPIRNQGSIGSCASHAALRAFEIQLKQNKMYAESSELYHYFNVRKYINNTYPKDTGMSIRDSWKGIHKFGVAFESAWSYDERKYNVEPPKIAYSFASFFKLKEYRRVLTIENIKDKIRNNIPVICGVWVDENYYRLNKLNFWWEPNKLTKKYGGHAQTIVGYNDEKRYFIIENSWGTSWGKNGICHVPYNAFNKISFDWWCGEIQIW